MPWTIKDKNHNNLLKKTTTQKIEQVKSMVLKGSNTPPPSVGDKGLLKGGELVFPSFAKIICSICELLIDWCLTDLGVPFFPLI